MGDETAERLAVYVPGLLDMAVKGALLLAFVGLAWAALRRASAAVRHLVLCLAMAGLLLLPLFTTLLPAWRVAPSFWPLKRASVPGGMAPAAPVAAVTQRPAVVVTVAPAPTPQSRPAHPAGTGTQGSRLWAWVVPLWVAGIIVCVLPLAAGQVALGRLRRSARRVEDGPWAESLRRVMQDLRCRRQVVLLTGGNAAMPMAWGCRRAHVLLPSESDSWPEERRRAVLLHEIAHVKRWDCAAHWVANLACAVHWFNPLAWVVRRRMMVERERACDDLVLAAGVRPSDYAGHLVGIAAALRAPTLTSGVAIAMARPSKLEGRPTAMLDATRDRRAPTRGLVLAAAVLALGACVPLAMLAAGSDVGKRPAPVGFVPPLPSGLTMTQTGAGGFDGTCTLVISHSNTDERRVGFISLERGLVLLPPFPVKVVSPRNFSFIEVTPQLREWIEAELVDMAVQLNDGDWGLMSCRTQAVDGDLKAALDGRWRETTPEQVRALFAKRDAAGHVSGDRPFSKVMWDYSPENQSFSRFRTRTGAVGVMHWEGLGPGRAAIKCQYRVSGPNVVRPEDRIVISGRVIAAAGLEKVVVCVHGRTMAGGAYYGIIVSASTRDGSFSVPYYPATFTVAVFGPGLAPVVLGPFERRRGQDLTNLEIRLDAGYVAKAQLVSADTRLPVAGGVVARSTAGGFGIEPDLVSDAEGVVTFPNASDAPLSLRVKAPGRPPASFENVRLHPDRPFVLELPPAGAPATGRVVDAMTGKPVPGAEAFLVAELVEGKTSDDCSVRGFGNTKDVLGVSDGEGRMSLTPLPPQEGKLFWAGVRATGYADLLVGPFRAGGEFGEARLDRPVTFTGELRAPEGLLSDVRIRWSQPFQIEYKGAIRAGFSEGHSLPTAVKDGRVPFRIEGLRAGAFDLTVTFGKETERHLTESFTPDGIARTFGPGRFQRMRSSTDPGRFEIIYSENLKKSVSGLVLTPEGVERRSPLAQWIAPGWMSPPVPQPAEDVGTAGPVLPSDLPKRLSPGAAVIGRDLRWNMAWSDGGGEFRFATSRISEDLLPPLAESASMHKQGAASGKD